MCCECVPIDGATCRQGKARQREAKAVSEGGSVRAGRVSTCNFCIVYMTKRRIVLVAVIVVVVVVIAVPVLLVPLLPLSSLHTDTHTCASSCATHTHTHSVAPMLALPISVGGAANSVLKPHVEAASDSASASSSVDALRAFLAKRCNSQIQLQIHLQNMKANGGHLSDSPEIVCS